MAGQNEPCPDDNFRFISIQTPDDSKDRTKRRLVRSHAVARGLEKKRKRLQQSGNNFLTVSVKENVTSKSKEISHNRITPSISLSIVAPGPFQLLAAESPCLQALLNQHSSARAAEPVFSVLDERVLENFQLVLRKGLDDRALLNAVMLTYTSSAASCNYERFKYQTEALSSLRQNLKSPDGATSEATLGAILLLAGIEARLGMPNSVQLHLGAIKQLLDICQKKGVYLGEAIKRAIFWQDLNCSIMTGSTRIVDHTTFSELQWTRRRFSSEFFVLPLGYKPLTNLLGAELTEIIRDIYALQRIRDTYNLCRVTVSYIDNHQANIQSRLVGLSSHSSFSECCRLALYLSSTTLRCKIWRTSVIPSHLSLQLLHKLQQANDDSIWDDHPGLLAWMLYMGGAFAPVGSIRSGYVALLHENRKTRLRALDTSWPNLLQVLEHFIWSEDAFGSQIEAFWRETQV